MSFSMLFLNGPVIGGVLGSVIPVVIGIAYYVCKFIIQVKQDGWRNISAEEWKEFARNIESEIDLFVNGNKKMNFHCEHCAQQCSNHKNNVNNINKNICVLKEKWVYKAKTNWENAESEIVNQQKHKNHENKSILPEQPQQD
ncbi:hypothetical protein [Mycoplasma suis]|uniref:Uncharacterized protein n=2 Tax=Mycoplasma suis TaxID=57372 RepID=F0QQ08_MYCSL|nr:hypothetical protein [Mycoplasma suis]ADX97578.1 hypothetical protein MSU_0034 [Mycoplasma suis str. Illinois]CBZ40122.1 hypothetical protein MSUIS_00290 [Mycoplasma suis KI3806]